MKKKTKAYAIVNEKDNVLANWGISYAVFTTKRKAKMFLSTAENCHKPKVVECEIILTIKGVC
jgi:hypothetical protein